MFRNTLLRLLCPQHTVAGHTARGWYVLPLTSVLRYEVHNRQTLHARISHTTAARIFVCPRSWVLIQNWVSKSSGMESKGERRDRTLDTVRSSDGVWGEEPDDLEVLDTDVEEPGQLEDLVDRLGRKSLIPVECIPHDRTRLPSGLGSRSLGTAEEPRLSILLACILVHGALTSTAVSNS